MLVFLLLIVFSKGKPARKGSSRFAGEFSATPIHPIIQPLNIKAERIYFAPIPVLEHFSQT
jgi:hypothetical protein